MRKITKTHAPAAYVKWVRDNSGGPACTYGDMPGSVKKCLKEQLLKEQGFLCAYTGREIQDETSHLEHLKPQKLCRQGEDVDYRNLVACFPMNGGATSHGYGALAKGSWWDAVLFVSPLSPECERRFIYTWSGNVRAFPDGDLATTQTIKQLALDHQALRELRKKAIDGFFGFSSATPITSNEALRLLQKIDRPNADGRLRPFCFVLKQLLKKHGSAPDSQRGIMPVR